MYFNSIIFLIFLTVVWIVHWWICQHNKSRNLVLILASYVFYGWWDYRFMMLLAFSTWLDFFSGIQIADQNSSKKRKQWLVISVSLNLGFLAVFKYYNFFITNFAQVFNINNPTLLNVILPVGISFYTFHGLSYVFDVYYNRIKPTRDIVQYGLFVSFFPLLVAGPIERATHLLPQLKQNRFFSLPQAKEGLRQILWGLVKKVIIADNCAAVANQCFFAPQGNSSLELALGAVFFAFQIYGDFSGYSDIALGTAKLFGVELLKNFNFPYFSRSIAEFWRRWHISLSSWFKDYIYIPLGGSKNGATVAVRNTFIIFLVSGFWHGANWTFIAWGLIHALLFIPSLIQKKNRIHLETVTKNGHIPSLFEFFQMLFTFLLVCLTWVFFRANSLTDAFYYLKCLFSSGGGLTLNTNYIFLVFLILPFIFLEWLGRRADFAIQHFLLNSNRALRWSFYYILVIAIFIFAGNSQVFIYFQF